MGLGTIENLIGSPLAAHRPAILAAMPEQPPTDKSRKPQEPPQPHWEILYAGAKARPLGEVEAAEADAIAKPAEQFRVRPRS